MSTGLESPVAIAALCALCALAGLAHGISGFGFPLISTPVVALVIDVRAAVFATLLPNIAVNVAGIATGAGGRSTLLRFWAMPLWVVAGTLVGSAVVLHAPPQPLRLLLAAMIAVYLLQDRLRLVDWSVIRRRPGLTGAIAGLAGGFLSGTVNVTLPPLLIYFATLGVAQATLAPVLNACFLVGKLGQAAVFAQAGWLDAGALAASAAPTLCALAGHAGGRRLAARQSPEFFRRLIRGALWAIAAMLFVQVGWAAYRAAA